MIISMLMISLVVLYDSLNSSWISLFVLIICMMRYSMMMVSVFVDVSSWIGCCVKWYVMMLMNVNLLRLCSGLVIRNIMNG